MVENKNMAACRVMRMRRAGMRLVALASVAMLQACSLIPSYQRPELAVPTTLAGTDAVKHISFSASPNPGEIARPDNLRSDAAVARQWEKVTAACQVLEDDISQLDGPINIGQIAVACGLGYADFRLTSHSWRDGRPKLTAWIANFNERPSMKATFFPRPK